MQRGSSDRLKAVGVEPFPALTEEEMSAYPTRENQGEEGTSQATSYDDAHKEPRKHGQVEENAVGGEKGRPQSLERQVCRPSLLIVSHKKRDHSSTTANAM